MRMCACVLWVCEIWSECPTLTRRLSVDRLLPRCMSASRILLPLTMRTCSSPPTMLPSRALPLLAMLAMLRWSLRWGGPEPAQLTAGLAARLLGPTG